MAYRPAGPEDKEIFSQAGNHSGGLSLLKNTGEPGEDLIIDGTTIAVLIDSAILGASVWFAFDDDFDPQDGRAVFYAYELKFLKTKAASELQKIHALKLGAVGLGTKVRQ